VSATGNASVLAVAVRFAKTLLRWIFTVSSVRPMAAVISLLLEISRDAHLTKVLPARTHSPNREDQDSRGWEWARDS